MNENDSCILVLTIQNPENQGLTDDWIASFFLVSESEVRPLVVRAVIILLVNSTTSFTLRCSCYYVNRWGGTAYNFPPCGVRNHFLNAHDAQVTNRFFIIDNSLTLHNERTTRI